MSAVHSNTKGKVFGLLGGEYFHFGFLGGNNKFCGSGLFPAITKQVRVLACINMMLWNVMKDCNILPDDVEDSPLQKTSKAVVN